MQPLNKRLCVPVLLMYILSNIVSLNTECMHLQTDNLHVPDIEMFFHPFIKDNSSSKSIKIQLTIYLLLILIFICLFVYLFTMISIY